MFEKFKKSVMRLVDHDKKVVSPKLSDEDRETLRNIKRTCEEPECHTSLLNDPQGVVCMRCSRLQEPNNFALAKMDMRHFKNRLDVFQYIRETCNNPKCYQASNRDVNAYTCIVCAEFRDDRFEEMQIALEKEEDTATRKILSQNLGHGANCNRVHRRFSCRPCSCNPNPGLSKPKCKCGKFTPEYKAAYQQYLCERDAKMEACKVLAFIRSTCDNDACNAASNFKITRFTPPNFSSGPACHRCESLYGEGKPDSSNYLKSKLQWERDVVQFRAVINFMRGTCTQPKCYFSSSSECARTTSNFCIPCYDALNYNLDGKKREMRAAAAKNDTSMASGGTSFTVGLSVVIEEDEEDLSHRSVKPLNMFEKRTAAVEENKKKERETKARIKAEEKEIDAMLSGEDSMLHSSYSPFDEE